MEFVSQRLLYRQFTAADLANFLSLFTDERVTRYITGKPLSEAEGRIRFEAVLKTNQQHTEAGFFSVSTKADGVFIGLAKFVYLTNNQVEIGYGFLPDFWGKQYASEVLNGLLTYAGRFPRVTQLVGVVDPDNAASIRVLTNCQFTRDPTEQPTKAAVAYRLDLSLCR